MTDKFTSPLIETEQLQQYLGDSDLRVLDCSVLGQPNKDGTYSFVSILSEWEQSHIPGSKYVYIPEQLSDRQHKIGLMMPAPETFIETMKGFGIGDDTRVVLYDRSNHAWAARVWWMLRVCGFDNAAVLNGGWSKWQAEARETSNENSPYPKANTFSLNYRPELMADKQKVLESIDEEEITLLHSLPLPMFTGDVSPYARPGRIPNSKNLYCETLINPDSKCYLEADTIRQMFSETGALDAQHVITYCGGGIAASSNALALTLLGVENVSIYDGSLSEWALDPTLPLETG